MNRNVNYLYKRSGLLTDISFYQCFGSEGGSFEPLEPPSYGPELSKAGLNGSLLKVTYRQNLYYNTKISL